MEDKLINQIKHYQKHLKYPEDATKKERRYLLRNSSKFVVENETLYYFNIEKSNKIRRIEKMDKVLIPLIIEKAHNDIGPQLSKKTYRNMMRTVIKNVIPSKKVQDETWRRIEKQDPWFKTGGPVYPWGGDVTKLLAPFFGMTEVTDFLNNDNSDGALIIQ
jgi:hypothetical protein